MMQLGLFGNNVKPRLSRLSDPPTSQQSATEARESLGDCQRAFLEALQSILGATGQAATAAEIALQAYSACPAKNRESYRKRAGELVKAGRIAPAGSRVCKITGKAATVYVLADRADGVA